MKTFLASLSLMALTAGTAFAGNAPAAASPAPAKQAPQMTGACGQIEAACQAAGYVYGEANVGKGLILDCINPIAAGKSIANVKVDPSLPAQCATQLAAQKQQKPQKK